MARSVCFFLIISFSCFSAFARYNNVLDVDFDASMSYGNKNYLEKYKNTANFEIFALQYRGMP